MRDKKRMREKIKLSKPKDVDSYVANSSRAARPILEELRKIIKSNIRNVEEGISWGVPFYKYHGVLAGFAAYKNHVSFGFCIPALRSEDRNMLEEKGYKTGKKTIQIKFGQKVPITAIKQILKVKANMNEVKRGQSSRIKKSAQ